jgi:hypothetical protein
MASEYSSRMTGPGNPPGDSEIADWIGKEAYRYWSRTVEWIDQRYPNVFGRNGFSAGRNTAGPSDTGNRNPSVR